MKTDLHRHLYGIYKIIKNRFDYINNSIGHSLTHGEENESEIRKLLVDFLPSDYGIGSGIIIDIDGNESNQVDIIIYDKRSPNYSLIKDSKIFLLDQVLATIEIKTTFMTGVGSSLQKSFENVESIKKLKPSQLHWVESDIALEEDKKQSWCIKEFKPGPPICAIFFYTIPERKKALNIDGFFKAIESEISKYPKLFQPDLLFSLEHSAFFKFDDIAKLKDGEFHICLLNLNDDPSQQVTITGVTKDYKAIINFGDVFFNNDNEVKANFINNTDDSLKVIALEGESLVLEPLVYKTGEIKGEIYFIDSYRGFMNFIFLIDAFLKVKKTNKNAFVVDYFPTGFFLLTDYKDGLNFFDKNSKKQ